jgi:hypothetical protein
VTVTDGVTVSRASVFASVFRTYRNVLGRPGALLRIASLPVAAIVVLTVLYSRIPWHDHPARGFYFLLLILPLSFMALAWTRNSLFDRRPRILPVRPWGSAYAKVLACYVLWALCLFFGGPFVVIAMGLLLAKAIVGNDTTLSVLLSYVPVAWLSLAALGVIPLAKLFFALPLIATGQPASPRAAWKLAGGLGLRLGGTLFLLNLSLLALAALCLFLVSASAQTYFEALGADKALQDPYYFMAEVTFPIALHIMAFLGVPLGTALFAETLAIAYREITGWTGAQGDIVERFE